ncbi:MAG: muramoyltetrapeptide carboxypeptidase [Cyclobacteriaceae bacterium]|jgi:muramoyltetrapeptide carboxypeptidase
MDRRKFILNTAVAGLGAPLISSGFKQKEITLIKPPALPKNGTIQLITPASALSRSSFEKTMENMEMLSFKIKYSDNIRVRSGFLSGTDEQRLQDLQNAFLDDTVDAVLCARGGYGSGRLLPMIDYDLIRNNPKIFIGFSDITALLIAFYQKSGLIGFHGPVGASEFNDFTVDCLLDTIQKGKHSKISNDGSAPIFAGTCEGRMIGGNLSILVSLIGTPFDMVYDDHILFLEEIGESTYRVDRMLTQLVNSGKLKKVKGIVLGYFTNCDTNPDDPYFDFSISLDEVFKNRFEHLGIPVAKGFPIGHEAHNTTIPLGIKASLDAEKGQIRMLESAVA